MTKLGSTVLSRSSATALSPHSPTTGKSAPPLIQACEIAEEILALQPAGIAHQLGALQERCRSLLMSLPSDPKPQLAESIGDQTMTQILATIYSPRWQVVIDSELQDGSQIRIRDLEARGEDPEVIASLKQDLEDGEPILNSKGEEVATLRSDSQEAVRAVLKAITINAGPEVCVVLVSPTATK